MTKIIMTGSFKGGTGKSTFLANLAATLAKEKKKVVIIDADIISPGIHALFGLEKKSFSQTLTNYLISGLNIEKSIYDISETLGLKDESLYLVPASLSPQDIAEYLSQNEPQALLKAIPEIVKATNPDIVLIDTHPGVNEEMLAVSEQADLFIDIIIPDNQDYQGLILSIDLSEKINAKTCIVINKIHKDLNEKNIINTIKNSLDIPIIGSLQLSNDIIKNQSQKIFTHAYPKNDYSEEIKNISRIIKKMKHMIDD